MPGAADLAIAAINTAQPLVTTPKNGGSTASWITAVAASVLALLGLVLPFIIKRMVIRNKRLDSIDASRLADIARMEERMAKLETKAETASEKAQQAENKLVAAVSAIALLSAEVKRLDPKSESPVLAQVHDLLAAATTGDFGLGRGMGNIVSKLAELP
jgi:hypothetical protein